jgi:hypothetical protein
VQLFIDIVFEVDIEDALHVGLHQMNQLLLFNKAFTVFEQRLALGVE